LQSSGPAITEREGAEVDEVLAGGLLPPGSRPLHADLEEALAGCLDVAAADGEAATSGGGVVHSLGVIL